MTPTAKTAKSSISFLNTLPPENRLILASAQYAVSSIKKEDFLQYCRQDLDWRMVFELAKFHRITPFLFNHLRKLDSSYVPAEIIDKVRPQILSHTRRIIWQIDELERILKLFAQEGINVIPYKGPLLGEEIYKNALLRVCNDLDFIIDQKDLSKIKILLSQEEYEPAMDLNLVQERAYAKSENVFVFYSEKKQQVLEFQWRLMPRLHNIKLDIQMLKPRSRQITHWDTQFPFLSPEDLFSSLCLHAYKHEWLELRLFMDLAQTISTYPGLNWSKVEEQSIKLGYQRVLCISLVMLNVLFNAVIPEEIIHLIDSDISARKIAEERLRKLLQKNEVVGDDLIQSTRLVLRTKERVFDKLHYLFYLLITTTIYDWYYKPLSPTFFFLYYVIRPWRLLQKYLWKKKI
ncbi:MAG: nucleotidyltransferase family protein [Fibrobacteria bacterium]|nr:nucleotidyltransferase family protein [Fibrobacteria bacterium]